MRFFGGDVCILKQIVHKIVPVDTNTNTNSSIIFKSLNKFVMMCTVRLDLRFSPPSRYFARWVLMEP